MEHVLANEVMRVTVRPDLGGRIDQITDVETGKKWLWHPDAYRGASRNIENGASFDDYWTGGWDEIFPNDAACTFSGRQLYDHGELWSTSWRVADSTSSSILLNHRCATVPVIIEKGVFLRDEVLNVRYVFDNTSDKEIPFLFKLHPALSVEPGDRLLLPSCAVEPVDSGFSTIMGNGGLAHFPYVKGKNGQDVDISVVLGPDAHEQEFFYSSNLFEGWCGLRNARTGKEIRFSFDATQMPYVWVFASYGKWRNHYVAIMEPCTNIPYDLETALRNGTCAVLAPRERREIIVGLSVNGGRGQRA